MCRMEATFLSTFIFFAQNLSNDVYYIGTKQNNCCKFNSLSSSLWYWTFHNSWPSCLPSVCFWVLTLANPDTLTPLWRLSLLSQLNGTVPCYPHWQWKFIELLVSLPTAFITVSHPILHMHVGKIQKNTYAPICANMCILDHQNFRHFIKGRTFL